MERTHERKQFKHPEEYKELSRLLQEPDVRKLFEDESYLSPVLKIPKGWELLRSFLRAQWPVAFHDQDILDIPPGLGTVWRKDKIKHPLPLREFEGRRLLPSVLLRDRSDQTSEMKIRGPGEASREKYIQWQRKLLVTTG